MSAATTVSARWFPGSQRGVATGIGYSGGGVGMIVAFVLGPLVLHDHAENVPNLLLLELGLATLALVACVALPIAATNESEFGDGGAAADPARAHGVLSDGWLERCVAFVGLPWRQPLLSTLAIIAGVQAGVSSTWQAVMPQQVAPPEFPSSTAGVVGVVNGVGNLHAEHWLHHLHQEGFVVLRRVLSEEECATAQDLLWTWLEGLGSGIRRDDIATWRNANWPGHARFGFFMSHGGGHSDAAWYVRSRGAVRKAFEAIWDTSALLCSLDTPIVWRPWWRRPPSLAEEEWRPVVERLHCDQNPVTKPGFHCVQGMVPLVGVSSRVGGLQVVPGTHGDATQAALMREYPELHTNGGDDWCELRTDDPHIGRGLLLEADAGDLILWDSRTIHGGLVGEGAEGAEGAEGGNLHEPARLARAAMTVCMTPRKFASEFVLRQRREAHATGTTLTHWPHAYTPHTLQDTDGDRIPSRRYTPRDLTEEERLLL